MNFALRFLKSFITFIQNIFTQSNKEFLGRSLGYAFQNIVRNPVISFSSVLILTLILVLFHASIAVKFFAEESIISINKKIDLIVEVKDGADNYALNELVVQVKTVPGVAKVQLVDKEAALSSFLQRHANIKTFLDKYQLGNPLPSYLEIATQTPAQIQDVTKILQDQKYAMLIAQTKMNTDIDQKQRIEKLIYLGNFVDAMGGAFLFIFILVAVLVTFNTVNTAIHQRKDEIHMMNLVGATKATIQAPYVLEGVLYTGFSLIVATLINLVLYFYILSVVNMSFSGSTFLETMQNLLGKFFTMFPSMIAFEGGLLLACSVLASFVAIEIYLKKHQI